MTTTEPETTEPRTDRSGTGGLVRRTGILSRGLAPGATYRHRGCRASGKSDATRIRPCCRHVLPPRPARSDTDHSPRWQGGTLATTALPRPSSRSRHTPHICDPASGSALAPRQRWRPLRPVQTGRDEPRPPPPDPRSPGRGRGVPATEAVPENQPRIRTSEPWCSNTCSNTGNASPAP